MDVVRGAGGVLWRRAEPGGELQVAVIHRPRYDDWTLPKGKLDASETELEAALREVREETGYRARPGRQLGHVQYLQTKQGRTRPKIVRYWAMEALDGAFSPGPEVDQLRWLPPSDAEPLLTYDRERDVLARFVRLRG
ncbi:MAG: NUDIX hydrolase [Actinomycetota bacterium]|nr:NUDIX hydrolase [Actinomycetota bacterium]